MAGESEKREKSVITQPAGWEKEVVRGYIRLVRLANKPFTQSKKIDGRVAEVIASDSTTEMLTLRILEFNSTDQTNKLFPEPMEVHVSNCVQYGPRAL